MEEQLREELLQVKEELTKLTQENDVLKTTNAELKKSNEDIKLLNQKLYLRVTTPIQECKPKPEVAPLDVLLAQWSK